MINSRALRASTIAVAALAISGIATIAPASAASCPLQKQADGTVYPVVCKNGKVNDRAEPKLAKSLPSIMALGKSANLAQAKVAICADLKNDKVTFPEIESALYFQTTKFGWSKKISNWFNDGIMMGSKKLC
jgi:hypothetical protein